MAFTVRDLDQGDIPRVLEIQAAAYGPHLLEDGDVFAAKIRDHAGWCLGAQDTTGLLGAYVISFPMVTTASVGLHETGGRGLAHGEHAPILYIHDLAVDPAVHGTGAGTLLLGTLESLGRAYGQSVIELVAIESAVRFWLGRGFQTTDDEVYAGYGEGARKMRRPIE